MSLNVEPGKLDDGLDVIMQNYVCNLPHVLRRHAEILAHGRKCTGGYMRLQKVQEVGVYAVLHWSCDMCGKTEAIETDPNGPQRINKAIVWGALVTGIGHYQLQELMALLNIHVPCDKYYRKLQKEVGKVGNVNYFVKVSF